MKVLILSCSTGQGHNSAGQAVYECLQQRGVCCEMRDALGFSSGRVSKNVCGAYVGITTHVPGLFSLLYSAGGLISTSRIKSVVYYANTLYAPKIGDYIRENGFDTVVVSHLFPAEALTYLRRKGSLSARCYAIATDYTCIPFWEETELDRYFIPHADLTEEFARKGIPADRLTATGIPVSQRFAQRLPADEARRLLKLPQQGRLYLVMTGSMGYGNAGELTERLLRRVGADDSIVIFGGNNETMKRELRTRYEGERRVRVLDFTRDVPLYMDACDLVFTKPGGLTSTEAAVKRAALAHTAPIPGCETKNAAFFKDRGLSLCDQNLDALVDQAVALANDPTARRSMAEAQAAHSNPHAAQDICACIEREVCGEVEQ
ncbi:MGDG synthase family glycosyltransferase [Feifania hominis]|uniref:Glycosyl transferase n=1 Tax=Feifania hominis TaxID=2763660 RepID=A0A926HUR3_9FIRM|nr:glycosyl transferase [Feifania hominis]MBC8537184.1 glycosyl transferase [Feifania hominis]